MPVVASWSLGACTDVLERGSDEDRSSVRSYSRRPSDSATSPDDVLFQMTPEAMRQLPQLGDVRSHSLASGTTITVIADDLTGANDSGLQFATRGLPAVVCLGDPSVAYLDGAAVVVVDTETRALDPDAIPALLIRLIDCLPAAGTGGPVYKKIDSTMRGHVGLEIAVLARAVGAATVFMTPAYPAMQRTVEEGRLLVGGVPVDRTVFARDPACPVGDARVARLLAPHMPDFAIIEVSVDALSEPSALAARLADVQATHGRICAVFDAKAADDLARVARFGVRWAEDSGRRVLWAGSAGLAAQLPAAWGIAGPPAVLPQLTPAARPPLVAVGSVNPVSIGQLQALVDGSAVEPVVLSPERLLDPNEQAREIGRCLAALERQIAAGNALLVLTTAHQRADVERSLVLAKQRGLTRWEAGRQIARGMAACTEGLLARGLVDRLVTTGGDTSRAVMDLAGIDAVSIEGALAQGIPVVKTSCAPVRHIVTKAGGFGAPDALMRAVAFLTLGRLDP